MIARVISWWRQSAALKQITLFLFTASISLLVYRLTLVREAEMSDPAELALQAYQLGLTHPPGYPVHTLLGHLFTRFFEEPALATNLLSAVCASLAIGVLSLIIFEVTESVLAGLVAPLVLAFSHKLWEMAIVTEVYDVNLFFFALAFYCFILWRKTQARSALVAAAIVFGISLGTYLANLLMLPAFLLLVGRTSKQRRADLAVVVGIVSGFGLLLLAYTLFRAQTALPMGVEAPPDTLPTALHYFAGEQYGTTSVNDIAFYLSRPGAHAQTFSESFLYVGVLFGLAGLIALWRRDRELALFTGLLFVLNSGYFTFYRAADYDDMVMPSYFVFAIWIGASVLWVSARRLPALLSMLALAALAGSLLFTQYPPKRARAYSRDVTNFGLWSLSVFPENAVVVSAWPRYTLLAYYQKTRGLRPDVTLIERETQQRYYEFGLIEDYADYVADVIDDRPVMIDVDDPVLAEGFEVEAVNASWFVVTPKASP